MSKTIDTREDEASVFVLKKIADLLRLREGGEYLYNCPSPNCLGMVKVVIKVGDGDKCCVTAQCIDSSSECDFPTLSGPLNWDYEGKEAD